MLVDLCMMRLLVSCYADGPPHLRRRADSINHIGSCVGGSLSGRLALHVSLPLSFMGRTFCKTFSTAGGV